MYPRFLDQLSAGESLLMLSIIATGGVASALLWQRRACVSLPRRDRWLVALLLCLCVGSFATLIASLWARLP